MPSRTGGMRIRAAMDWYSSRRRAFCVRSASVSVARTPSLERTASCTCVLHFRASSVSRLAVLWLRGRGRRQARRPRLSLSRRTTAMASTWRRPRALRKASIRMLPGRRSRARSSSPVPSFSRSSLTRGAQRSATTRFPFSTRARSFRRRSCASAAAVRTRGRRTRSVSLASGCGSGSTPTRACLTGASAFASVATTCASRLCSSHWRVPRCSW